MAERDEDGSILLETALGVALILGIALPFASVVSYATYSARDLASVQAAARSAARSEQATATDPAIRFGCGTTPSVASEPCGSTLTRATYVSASKDTIVQLPFGLELHTAERAVARVE